MLTSFDVLSVAAAFLCMLAGLSRKWRVWLAGKNRELKGDWSGLVTYLIRHDQILKRRFVGVCHLCLFWGSGVFLLVVFLSQFKITMGTSPARILSVFLDLLGFLMLAATVGFLVRRLWRRLEAINPIATWKTLLPLAIMLIVLSSGFAAEGARLSILRSGFTWSSPVGSWLSSAMPPSPLFMQILIRIHFFSVLLLVAVLPFTTLRHLASASANVLYRSQEPRGASAPVPLHASIRGAGTVLDLHWKQMLDAEACVACGRCEEHCPAFLSGKPLSPRKVMRAIYGQLETVTRGRWYGANASFPFLDGAVSDDEIWACTTCMACVHHCPVFVEPMDKIIDMRRFRVMSKGLLPAEAIPMIRDLELFGDVQGKGTARRKDWALNRKVPVVGESLLDMEVLLWVGCSGGFHPRSQDTARAMARILDAGGVAFGILGIKEHCCGDPARRLGDEPLFRDLAEKNIRWLDHFSVKKIVTLCPHCLHVLKNEYPAMGGRYEVTHAVEFVADLIRQGRISLKYPCHNRIAVQDPCYLGRYNQVYEPIREICDAVPGMKISELARNRENSFCCGGGGGRMWLHESIGESINGIRAKEALGRKIDIIGTACPYCLTMLEDGIKSAEVEDSPKVMDIIEIVADSIEDRVGANESRDDEE